MRFGPKPQHAGKMRLNASSILEEDPAICRVMQEPARQANPRKHSLSRSSRFSTVSTFGYNFWKNPVPLMGAKGVS